MTSKPVIPRERAHQDIQEAVDYFLRQAGKPFTIWFINSLEKTFRHIAESPQTAFIEHTQDLDLPGMRVWPPLLYPYVVFFIERDNYIDVCRVLYSSSDILDVIQPRPSSIARARRLKE